MGTGMEAYTNTNMGTIQKGTQLHQMVDKMAQDTVPPHVDMEQVDWFLARLSGTLSFCHQMLRVRGLTDEQAKETVVAALGVELVTRVANAHLNSSHVDTSRLTEILEELRARV